MRRLKTPRARPAPRPHRRERIGRLDARRLPRPRRDRRRTLERAARAPAERHALRSPSSTCAPCTPRAARSPRPAGRRTSCSSSARASCVAACPLYLKDHSYGEYVFDWAWADAYRRHGLDYYPKLTGAIPFTPVPGPRLLAATHEQRVLLLRGIEAAGAPGRDLLGAPAVPRRRRPGRGGRRRLVDAQHGAVPLAATATPSRMPTSPTSWPACSARSARRSSRSGAGSPTPASASRGATAARSAPPTGPSSTAATRSPTARTTRRPT